MSRSRAIAWAWLLLVVVAAMGAVAWAVSGLKGNDAMTGAVLLAGPLFMLAWMLARPALYELFFDPPPREEPAQHGGRTLGELMADAQAGSADARPAAPERSPVVSWILCVLGGATAFVAFLMHVAANWGTPRHWGRDSTVWPFVILAGAVMCRVGLTRLRARRPGPP